MNKRIDALEVQAWEIVDNTWDWTKPDNPSKATLFKTIFAELIVRECLGVAHQEHKNALEFDWDNDDTAQTIRDSISEHFGVEE